MTAYICYENVIGRAEITVPADPEYPKENAYDWFTYTFWKGPADTLFLYYAMDFPEPVTIDYYAIAAHDMNTTSTRTLMQYWDYDIEDWEEWSGVKPTPVNNAPQLYIDEPKTSDRWRLYFDWQEVLTPCLVGVLSMGQLLELPEGIRAPFVPPPLAYDNKIINSVSQTGQFLGRSIERYGEKMTIHQNQVDPAWVRANWKNMADVIETQPFFYSWNYEEYPEDTVYAWLNDPITPPHYTNSIHTSFELKCKSLHEMRWF